MTHKVTTHTTATEMKTATIMPLTKTWPGISAISAGKKKKTHREKQEVMNQRNVTRISSHHNVVASFAIHSDLDMSLHMFSYSPWFPTLLIVVCSVDLSTSTYKCVQGYPETWSQSMATQPISICGVYICRAIICQCGTQKIPTRIAVSSMGK